MIIYPAIDIKGGKAVRLLQGKAENVTNYGDPQFMAQQWKDGGASWIHVVDLDGAFTGTSCIQDALAGIVRTGCNVQTGGGIRAMSDIDAKIDAGVARVILGTVAIENPELVAQAAQKYPGKIAVGIDAKDGKVATRGWVNVTAQDAVELALRVKDMGVDTIIYTDIACDGMLSGPSVDATQRMVQNTGMNIIGSGGIGCLEDLVSLSRVGVAGIIVGKSLYEHRFTLEQVLAVAKYEEDKRHG